MHLIAALPYWEFGPWTPIDAIPSLQIHAFGLMVAIGLITCLTMGSWRAEKKLGIHGEKFQNFALWLIVIGWIFAHVFNMIFYHPGAVAQNPLVLLKVWGSVSSYGGLLGGAIALVWWLKRHPEADRLLWFDHAAWSLTFAWFFGRVGCALVHDHPGSIAPEGWPLAFNWPDGTIRHDLGFYEAIWWFVIAFTVWFVDRKPRKKGLYTALVPLMYAPVRFILDFMRTWPSTSAGEIDVNPFVGFFLDVLQVQPEALSYGGDARYFGLTPAQYLSIGLFIVGLIMLYRIRDNDKLEWKEYDYETDSARKTDE